MSKKHKRYIIPKNRDIEDVVYRDAEKNDKKQVPKDNFVMKFEEQRENFVEEIKVKTTGLCKGASQKRHERILAEEADERRQVEYLRAAQKLQEEEQWEI